MEGQPVKASLPRRPLQMPTQEMVKTSVAVTKAEIFRKQNCWDLMKNFMQVVR